MRNRAALYLARTATVIFTWVLLLPLAQAGSTLQIGDRAADWILTDHEGKAVTFYQDSGERPAVLFFWSSWCKDCAELMPQLDELQQQLDQQDIRFYALNIWDDVSPANLVPSRQSNFTLLFNADRVARRYKVRRAPGLFVVKGDKSISYIRRGNSSIEEVVEAIRAAATQQ